MPRQNTKRIVSQKQWRHVVALTGGLGSGKSAVLDFFRSCGAFGLSADAMVRHLFKHDASLRKTLVHHFGRALLTRRHQLDRKKLAQVVFHSSQERRRLESWVHPRVKKALQDALRRRKGTLAVCEIPLLYECGWDALFDQVVVVHASRAVRLKRLKKKGMPQPESLRRMKAQWPLAEKNKKADFVVNNNGRLMDTKKQVSRICRKIVEPNDLNV